MYNKINKLLSRKSGKKYVHVHAHMCTTTTSSGRVWPVTFARLVYASSCFYSILVFVSLALFRATETSPYRDNVDFDPQRLYPSEIMLTSTHRDFTLQRYC